MNNPIQDGGPAFPVKVRHVDKYLNREGDKVVAFGEFPTEYETGMTLRDWFVGQMISGLVSTGNPTLQEINDGRSKVAERLAAATYKLADAMLKAREAKP